MQAVAITPRHPNTTRLIDIPPPRTPPDGARVRVLEVGVCGTDAELEAGHIGKAPPREDHLVIGHECFGVVEETGNEVASLQPGDYVVATVRRPDDCPNCRAGSSDMCITGDYTERGITAAHGFLTDFYAEHEQYLVKIPPALRGAGVLLEPLSVAEKAVRHAWEIQRRLLWEPRSALVFGAGTLGLLAAFLLRLRGLDVSVYSREPRESARAKMAERAGCEYMTSLPNAEYDFVFEASGAAQLILAGPERLRRNGVMVLLGVCSSHDPHPVAAGDLNNRIVLGNQVIFGSVNSNRRDFDQGVLDLGAMEQRWPGLLAGMFTRREPFEHYARALRRSEDDIKVLVEMKS